MGMRDNIILIGFMGTQKTSAGQALARLTGREFVDMDALIEKKAGMSIREIFERSGEDAFRLREQEAALELGKRENLVVSTGGGAVLREETMGALVGVRVLLVCAPDELWARVGGDVSRPVLKQMDKAAMEALLEARWPYYERYADVSIDTTGSEPQDTALRIVRALSRIRERRREET